MFFYSHLAHFNNRKTTWFTIEEGIENHKLAYRIAIDSDEEQEDFKNKLFAFCDDEKAKDIKQLVIGVWFTELNEDSSELIQLLVANKDKLYSLEALMIGDITNEETDVFWIKQSNINPIFDAFPNLKNLHIRGGNRLELGEINHHKLESLIIESTGLDEKVLHQLGEADLPNLKYLKLYLSDPDEGWIGSISDIKLLFRRNLFPNLRYLGLINTENTDDIAEFLLEVKDSIKSLKELGLNGGDMTDKGVEYLLKNESLSFIDVLYLEGNCISDEMVQKIHATDRTGYVKTACQKSIGGDDDSYYVDVYE